MSAPGVDLTLDPTESESTTQDMHGSRLSRPRRADDAAAALTMEGRCAPYRACRSRLAIAVLHMVPSSASACTNTAAGSQAGKLTLGDVRASPVGVKWLQRRPPIQLGKSGASDPRYAHH